MKKTPIATEGQPGMSTPVAIGIILLVVGIGVGGYFLGRGSTSAPVSDEGGLEVQESTQQKGNAELTSFSVAGKNFVVKGKYLSKVEIKGTPTGTGITEDMHDKFATSTSYTGTLPSQTFTIPIPCDQSFGVTSIYVVGYDQQGNYVSKQASAMTLKASGVSQIYEEIYAPACESQQVSQNTVSCSFTSPKAGDVWKFGSTHTVSLKDAPLYGSHCSGGFGLKNEDTGEYAGDVSGSQQSFGWTISTGLLHQRCGTGREETWAPIAPGRYKLSFWEQPDITGDYPINTCESGVFTITN